MKKIIAVCLTDTHLKDENIEVNKSVFRQAFEFCVNHNIDDLHHLGDIFNSRKSQSQDVLIAFKDILDEAGKKGVNLLAIKGNHDSTSYESSDSFLEPFTTHPSFQLFSTSAKVELNNGVVINLLSHFSEQLFIETLSYVTELLDTTKRNVLFSHNDIDGGKMNGGAIISNRITSDLFKKFELVLMGHWHDKQVIDNIHFIGSSIQHNFGETPDKGLTVLYDDLTWETVELDFPRFHKIEIDIDKLTQKEVEEIRLEKSQTKDHFKVVLVGSEEKVKSFNKQTLLNSGITVEHKINRVEKQDVDNRVEPFNSESLLSEFSLFCEKNKLDKQEGLKYLTQVI